MWGAEITIQPVCYNSTGGHRVSADARLVPLHRGVVKCLILANNGVGVSDPYNPTPKTPTTEMGALLPATPAGKYAAGTLKLKSREICTKSASHSTHSRPLGPYAAWGGGLATGYGRST